MPDAVAAQRNSPVDDLPTALRASAAEQLSAFQGTGPLDRTCQHVVGPVPGCS